MEKHVWSPTNGLYVDRPSKILEINKVFSFKESEKFKFLLDL